MPFDQSVELLISLFLFLAMLCIGMSATLKEMATVISDRTRTTRALVANLVVPPIVALVLTALISMPDAMATVLILLAFAPGGINAIQFSTKAPGQMATAGALLFLLTIIALIVTPIVARFVIDGQPSPQIPAGPFSVRLFLLMVLPLVIGIALQTYAPEKAKKLYKPAMLISTLAFIASVVISTSVRQDALAELGSGSAIAIVLFVLCTMAAGWIFGGPEEDHKQALAVSTNLRNVGLVYVIVDQCCGDQQLTTAVLAFMALMVPPNLVLTIFCGVMRKRRASKS